MPTAVLPLAVGAAALLVPPIRHRALSVGKVAASTGLGVATVTVRGARDLAQAAVTGHDPAGRSAA